ncbi:DUF697 domain-containing protein [Marinigracilibium pacificum]|uniref:DUF697 domain-containing protein n=1 Tax=Marinigracilibium pacificum TaxID=2729599 RepID=A0A848J7Y0_9BACT|nr:DUF697 domain-containing protein [Marinigracilibium pacificum]NMM49192.1 DUF697 domain-containing protein [Marinigracilibium pacificum]
MKSQLKKLVTTLSILIIIVFLIFTFNQLIDLYANLFIINQTLAIVVTSVVSVLVFGLILIPFVIFLKLPKAITKPLDDEDLPEYRRKVIKRLASNKLIKAEKFDLSTEDGISSALSFLNEKADKAIYDTASNVFLTTAISQNGKLDAFTVLVTQTRMVWQVSHIYWQRPALKDMLNLYANVGGATFLATEIEDMDISRQIEPIIGALVKSPGRSLPLVGHAAHIITDSLLEGSTNAFLTLRVGVVTKRYCGAINSLDKREIRRNSFIEASGMLKSLVYTSSSKVIKSLLKATKDTGVNTVKSGLGAINKAARSVKEKLENLTKRSPGEKALKPGPDTDQS